MNIRKACSAACLAGTLAACQQATPPDQTARIIELEAKVLALEVGQTEAKERSEALETALGAQTDFDEPGITLIPSPNDARWVVGRSRFGKYATYISDLTPKGRGTTATINFLNMAAVRIENPELSVFYSDRTHEDQVAAIRAGGEFTAPPPVEYKFEEAMPPGTWVRYSVVLPDLPPDKIKVVTVKVDSYSVRGL